MSGYPRWIYAEQRPLKASFIAEVLASAADTSREGDGSRELRDRATGSGVEAGAGVRVPVEAMKRLQQRFSRRAP